MEQWSSRIGFLLAAIGAAVGLGNIWRFPAIVGQEGGGAYLLPYLIAAFAFAIPLMILEISVGRSLKADVVTACRMVKDEYAIVGWLIAGSVLAVLSYYLVITGWVLAFFLTSVSGSQLSFQTLTETNYPIALFLLSTALVGVIVSFGVQRGIERMAKVLIPSTFLILVLLLVYATTLAGFQEGLRYFFTPDFGVLSEPRLWSAAFGQVFFSFSVGMGVLLTYGSYLHIESNVGRYSVVIAVADLTVAFLAGIVIFTVVFTSGLEPAMGTELAFRTIPDAFSTMPFGSILAIAFFGVLFVAAIAPSVSMLELGVAGTMRATDWSRKRSTLVLTFVVVATGIPSAMSYSAIGFTVFDRPFLDVLDSTVGAYALPISALAIVAVFTWAQDQTTVADQLDHSFVLPLVKFVVPVILATVVVLRLYTDIETAIGRRIPAVVFSVDTNTLAVAAISIL